MSTLRQKWACFIAHERKASSDLNIILAASFVIIYLGAMS